MPRELDPQVQAFVEEVAKLGYGPIHEMTTEEARASHDDIADRFGGGTEPIGQIEDSEIEGPAGKLPVRIYTPEGDGPFPILVYFHGGGWTVGNCTSSDPFVQRLSNRAGCVAVSVEYRLAPEHPFPAATEDAYSAIQWVADNADRICGNEQQIAVGGDAAGGTLAAVVSLMARDRGGPSLAYQLLYYAAFDLSSCDTDSYREDPEAEKLMEWALSRYLPNVQDRLGPYASPLLASDLTGLPPALVLTCEFDFVRDEGEAYARRLEEAGVSVKHSRYEGMIHGFLGLYGAIDRVEDAIAESAAELRVAFK